MIYKDKMVWITTVESNDQDVSVYKKVIRKSRMLIWKKLVKNLLQMNHLKRRLRTNVRKSQPNDNEKKKQKKLKYFIRR